MSTLSMTHEAISAALADNLPLAPDQRAALLTLVAADKRAQVLWDTAAKWQPIETAPKDGTPIMGCFWQPELAHLYSPRRIFWAAYHPNSAGKTCWRDAPICGNKLERLTHWAPLVVAPAD